MNTILKTTVERLTSSAYLTTPVRSTTASPRVSCRTWCICQSRSARYPPPQPPRLRHRTSRKPATLRDYYQHKLLLNSKIVSRGTFVENNCNLWALKYSV